jgi:hypothetical protein
MISLKEMYNTLGLAAPNVGSTGRYRVLWISVNCEVEIGTQRKEGCTRKMIAPRKAKTKSGSKKSSTSKKE